MERSGVVTSSVLFYSERIIIDLNSKPYRYMLECKDQFYSVEPLSGIIKAKNPFRSTEMLWKPNADDEDTSVKERVSITIDVSTILSTSPNVIAVLNVKRASWSYFVYEVVLFTSVKIVDVLVENSESSVTIYNNPPDALIARVERYCQDVTSAEYVVVHEFRKGSNGLLPRTHILELVDTDGKKIYEEVYKQRKKHIEMVTNSIRDEQSS
uniref:Uncharacterized protein n=2 Tax=Babesia bovis TaxID=5865 RepID=A7ASG3_BABBO|eukprot:XP_001611050.1 hypothetical protein [Babesia bovis T2Bo]